MALPPETRVPSIPNPASDPEGFLRAVQEVVQVREGARGNPLDRGVTFRDLVDAGLAAPNPAFAGKGRIPASALITPTGAGGAGGALGTGVRPVLTVPPKPRDVVAVGTFTSILIAWAQPDYSNHAHAEILRAAVNDIGQAVAIGSSVGRQYADAVGTDADYYYWVRYVSTGNVKGPASASVRGKTALDPQYVMANLLSTTWQPNTAYTEFQYVRPTVDNGLMYRCTQDGTSGVTEPVWPTTVGVAKTDGTAKWTTVAQTERVPFTIGTVNGQPAVVMDTAYIADATITVAKIKDAFLDNLTAIHGTLNFARIEQGNIFELTIGGDIKSETFSPFYNTGFIIRNEPGRDPGTPGLREYTAEFYGDTLFSGDIRAARIMAGMLVGSTFGVPSEADNGSYEFISNMAVVSDSTVLDRQDSYATVTVNVIGFPDSNLVPRTDVVQIQVYARQFNNYNLFSSGSSFNLYPMAGYNGSTVTFDRNTYDYYSANHWDYPLVDGKISHYTGGFDFGAGWLGLTNAQKYARAYAPMLAAPISMDQARWALPGAFNSAKIISNPLNVISSSAVAPFNYHRYKKNHVSCLITFNRASRRCHTAPAAWAPITALGVTNPELTDWDKSYIELRICKGTTGEVLRRVMLDRPRNAWEGGGQVTHQYYYGVITRITTTWFPNPSTVHVLNYSDDLVDVHIVSDTVFNGSWGHDSVFAISIRAGSTILLKNIEFLHSVPEGLVLTIEHVNERGWSRQVGVPAGLDIGVTFSTAMDNTT